MGVMGTNVCACLILVIVPFGAQLRWAVEMLDDKDIDVIYNPVRRLHLLPPRTLTKYLATRVSCPMAYITNGR